MDSFQNANMVPPALAANVLNNIDSVDTRHADLHLPPAFGNALDRNPDAKAIFADLPDGRKHQILQQSQKVRNRREMQELIRGLTEASFE